LVNATMAQLNGMYDGYSAAIKGKPDMNLTFDEFYLISYASDLSDVAGRFGNYAPPPQLAPQSKSHCSFCLRLTNESLFVAHTTWTEFTGILKIYKVLDFFLWNSLAQTKRMTYSAQPGSLPSQDDWYIVDDNKLITETTLVSYNNSVFNWIHYDSVPYWIRINVANLVYKTQETWRDTYFRERSGTYNNQWLVVDFNNYFKYKNNMTEAVDIIWMVEEFYGFTSTEDQTQALLIPQGYVSSYNVPYNQTLQIISQDPTNYTSDPRAILFKKYAPTIQTMDDFRFMMRLNNHSDTNDYCEAIASRCDLQYPGDFPFGAVDCKVSADNLVGAHQAWIIDGPTTEFAPPFNWTNWPQYSNNSLGMPEILNFTWVFLDPTANFTLAKDLNEYTS